MPEITLESVLDGSTSKELQTYIQDQFPFRSQFVNSKTAIDVVMGKNLINGVYICGDTLVQQFGLYNNSLLLSNTKKVNAISEKVDIPVKLLIIPSQVYTSEELLPENHLDSNQDELIELISGQLKNVEFIDVRESLRNSDSNPFYRTDHHLTLDGTSILYNEILSANNQENREYNFDIVAKNFKGSLSSKSGAFWIDGDNIQKYTSTTATNIEVKIVEGDNVITFNSVYNDARLAEKDKYTYYLDGNHALVEINTNQPEKENILVVADSYGHALAPFLVDDYNKITVVDLRYYKMPVSELAKDYDSVLIYYSLVNFSTDTNITFLK